MPDNTKSLIISSYWLCLGSEWSRKSQFNEPKGYLPCSKGDRQMEGLDNGSSEL